MTIPSILYKEIADALDGALFSETQASTEIDSAKTYISNLKTVFELEVSELNNSIIALSKIITNRVTSPQSIDKIITPLQQTIISEGYSDIDEYLSDNGIKVKGLFAARSDVLGYSIDPSNIE